jgi:hypothetical protein
MRLVDYSEDLICPGSSNLDIVKVECPSHVYDMFIYSQNGKAQFNTIWERFEAKEMTVEEIQQALGYKIKVVESKR